MQTKICSKCGIEKSVEEFYKKKDRKFGVRAECKICSSKDALKYYTVNKENIREVQTNWRNDNKDTQEYIQKQKEGQTKWYINNTEKAKEKTASYKRKPESILKEKQRRIEDHVYRLKKNLSSGLSRALNEIGSSKNGKRSDEIRGCTNEFLKSHIEKQFLEGMSWDNFHLWHIDHFIPQASANCEAELLKLNYWYNLRPLWVEDNLKKSDNAPYTLKFEPGVVEIIPFLLIDGLFIRNRISNYKGNLSTVSESIVEVFLND